MNEPPPRSEPSQRPDLEANQTDERIVTEDELPATVAQVKSLRWWVVVAGVWAVAATAIAVFALIEASKEDEAVREQAVGEIGRVQRQLNDRIDELEQRMDELPTSEEVAALDERLEQVDANSGKISNRIAKATGRIDEIERQVSELEEAAQATDTAPTQTTPTQTTP